MERNRHNTFMRSLVLFLLITPVAAAQKKKDAYDSESVMSSWALGQQGEACFQFFSFMTAGDFFKGLQYVRSRPAANPTDEFRKDGRAVVAFPDRLQVDLSFFTCPCSGNKTVRLLALELNALIDSLQIQASWKTGVELRPADLIASPELGARPTPNPFIRDSFMWGYRFFVRTQDVPLTDHLVISVLGRDRLLFGRVTFDLRVALTPSFKPIR